MSPLLCAQDPAPARYETMAEELLRDSIARETAHGLGQVPAYAKFLQTQFLAAGFAAQDITIVPYEGTASLLVRYRGDGSSNRRPILFSSHMDVVPADPNDWVRNPFELQEDETFYFGRGVLDNKFDVSMLTTLFIWLKEDGYVPNRDLVIAFTGDEESFQETVQQLTRDYREAIDAEFAFVVDGGGGVLNDAGEAISYKVGFAEKTYATFSVTARNPGGHSSMPRSDNAIFDLSDALKRLQDFRFPVETNEITLTFFERTAPLLGGKVGDAMARLVADPSDAEAIEVLRQKPEYVGTLGTTCIPTMLAGGHAENALPQSATATVNCRIFPGNSVADIMGTLQLAVENPELDWSIVGIPVSSDASPFNSEVMTAVKTSLEPIYPGIPVIPQMGSGTTDGAYFRAAGIPSYSLTGIFINPKDSFAHGLNERIPKISIPQSLIFWRSMVEELAGSNAAASP
jgi:acetylornithine deacetylase/succinyl-diaminopimelate desuccinylase-like protein